MTRETCTIFLLIGVAAVLSAMKYAASTSPDLLATWMAGLSFARGEFGAIYPPLTEAFEMRPPQVWIDELHAAGHEDSIYPFIYPPLWAWLAGHVTQITDFPTFVKAANLINPALLGLTLWLAARMAAEEMPKILFVIVGALLFASTTISLVALEQNQPQIFVAFLTVLAVERTRAGAPVWGGAALALAAAIKLYPVLFALIWLAQGERRAVASFAGIGAALGLLSIAVAGWPLHAEFLAQIRLISGTVLVTYFSHSLDPLIGDMFFSHEMRQIMDLDFEATAGWNIMAKPAWWSALNSLSMIGLMIVLMRMARGAAGRDPMFWPLVFAATSLLGPLSWGYHYLAAVAFLPALVVRLGPAAGIFTIMALLFPTSVLYILSETPLLPFGVWAGKLGVLAMTVFALICAGLATGRLSKRSETLAPA